MGTSQLVNGKLLAAPSPLCGVKGAETGFTLDGRLFILVVLVMFWLASGEHQQCRADVYHASAGDWSVYWNRPDQNRAVSGRDQWDIQDALTERIEALGSGDRAILATVKFADDSAAGPVMTAMDAALGRGATIQIIVDDRVQTGWTYAGFSLDGLSQTYESAMAVVKSPADAPGLMHHKAALFDYAGTSPGRTTVWCASSALTAWSNHNAWEIATRFDDNSQLFDAFHGEFSELIEGRFRDDPGKSHAFNRAFLLTGQWSASRVRFAPHPDVSSPAGDNAGSDIIAAIHAAEHSLLFALDRFTSTAVRDAILERADAGLLVYGVMSVGDTLAGMPSRTVYESLRGHPNVTFLVADEIAGPPLEADDGSVTNLVHAKYMILDAGTSQGMVIHGSANWTASTLFGTDQQEEDILFLRHREMAEAFLANFDAITAGQRRELPVPEPRSATGLILGIILVSGRATGRIVTGLHHRDAQGCGRRARPGC